MLHVRYIIIEVLAEKGVALFLFDFTLSRVSLIFIVKGNLCVVIVSIDLLCASAHLMRNMTESVHGNLTDAYVMHGT